VLATLDDLELAFRSLKSELGLPQVYRLKVELANGRLFISVVVAYQCVQLIRWQLKAKGMDQRWSGLREMLSVQRRVTARFTQRDGRSLNVRKGETILKAFSQSWRSSLHRKKSSRQRLAR